MLGILTLEIIIVLAIGIAGLLFSKIRKRILGKKVLTTSIYSLSNNKAYFFRYVHGLFLKKAFTLTLDEDDDKVYIIKEIVYYNFNTDINISVFKNSVVVYTIDLKNVVFQQNYDIEEIE